MSKTDLHVLNMHTRMPFRYGIASMTGLPHLFVEASVRVDGQETQGLAADGLPPKWFTKNPHTSFQDDLSEMLEVIHSARRLAVEAGEAETVFDFWQQIYQGQLDWGKQRGYPPLLVSFGTSLIERALLMAFCRAQHTTFWRGLRNNLLGLRLGEMHRELADFQAAELLPEEPLKTIFVRHTVGLTDALTEEEIPPSEKLDDGLPQSLEASIRAYGLSYFKIKLGGNPEADMERLRRLALVLSANCKRYAFTLDGNEQYPHIGAFREMWQSLTRIRSLQEFMQHLLFVEQPLHRDATLAPEAARALRAWKDRPALIIDESDDLIESLPKALEAGYVGTSHKNCKGIFKGIANACLIEQRHRQYNTGPRSYILSGEDLTNVGPVALCQDLAVMATLGVAHVERNGHHYFRGLSMFEEDVQNQVLDSHGDLYRRSQRGFATLNISQGQVRVESVVRAPFGVGFAFDPSRYTPLQKWRFESL